MAPGLTSTMDVSADAANNPGTVKEWRELLVTRFREASSFQEKMDAVGLCRDAVEKEPHSTSLWFLHCEWLWLLYKNAHGVKNVYPSCELEQDPDLNDTWPEEDKVMAQSIVQWGTVTEAFERAVEMTQDNINDSNLIWDAYLELRVWDLSQRTSHEKAQSIHKAFLQRLQEPHATWDRTFSAFSHFVSGEEKLDYEQEMVQAKQLSKKAKSFYEKRQAHEDAISSAAYSRDSAEELLAYHKYIAWEETQSRPKKGQPPSSCKYFIALCERATSQFPREAELWLDYVTFMMQKPLDAEPLFELVQRATDHCPGSGELWEQFIYIAEACEMDTEDIHQIKHTAMESGALQKHGMEERMKLDFALCSALRRRAFAPNATEDDRDYAEMGIRECHEAMMDHGKKVYGQAFAGDPAFRLERIYLRFLAQTGRLEDGRKLFKQLEPTYGNASFFYERWYLWEMTNHGMPDGVSVNENPAAATVALERALRRPDLDWPEKIIDMYLHHCAQHEDVNKILEAAIEIRRLRRSLGYLPYQVRQLQPGPTGQKRAYVDDDEKQRGVDEMDTDETSAKRARTQQGTAESTPEAPTTAKRDREHTTMSVRNLPATANEASIRRFFRDCGKIVSIKVMPDREIEEGLFASLEFEGTAEALAALTRDKKDFDGQEIDVQLGEGATVWVTNYPPTADEAYIRSLFEQFGKVVEVRFPSLRFNALRRFCYVQFPNKHVAKAATELDGQIQKDNQRLVVKISDPSKRNQAKTGPAAEGREIYVSNVSWFASEAEIHELFQPFGDVDSVRLPKKINGQSKGIAFVVFAEAKAASSACQMNSHSFKERVLHVEISNPDVASLKNHRATYVRPASSSAGSPAPGDEMAVDSGGAGSSAGRHPVPPHLRSFAIMNIPDTVTLARVQEMCRPHGTVVKMERVMEHGGASVEFDSQAQADAARTAIAGSTLDGAVLTVGSLRDLRREKAPGGPGQPATMFKPSSVSARGRGRGRGALGSTRHVASRQQGSSASSSAAAAPSGTSASDGVGKTQDDFRRMLLGGPGAAQDKSNDSAK